MRIPVDPGGRSGVIRALVPVDPGAVEFEARAVRLVLKEGQTVAQVGRDLDLAELVLHGCVKREPAQGACEA